MLVISNQQLRVFSENEIIKFKNHALREMMQFVSAKKLADDQNIIKEEIEDKMKFAADFNFKKESVVLEIIKLFYKKDQRELLNQINKTESKLLGSDSTNEEMRLDLLKDLIHHYSTTK